MLDVVHESNLINMLVRKCRCGSSWCAKCAKKGVMVKIKDRLALFDWRKTRHVTLSVDRDLFSDGKVAHSFINDKRLIPQLIHNLKRTSDVCISDWLWVLEWHSDGFPHYHLFIEVEKEGRAGMIGGELLRKYWPWGRWIKEWYIKTERHWDSLRGYFGKHGYFGTVKGVQGLLPDWAIHSERRIRRFGCAVLPGVDGEVRIKNQIKSNLCFRGGAKRRSYFSIISECGTKSKVELSNHILKISRVVDVPSSVFRDNFEGNWVEKMGYVCMVEEFALFALAEKYSGLLPLVDEMLEAIERYDGFNGWTDDKIIGDGVGVVGKEEDESIQGELWV